MANESNILNASTTNPATTTFFAANVGDVIRIRRPVGYPHRGAGSGESEKKYECLGFKIMNEDLGHFVRTENEEYTPDNSLCVYYKHEKSGKQVIQYNANGGLKPIVFYITIQGITVHDHGSIHMGGPAYATYYAEVPEEMVEE